MFDYLIKNVKLVDGTGKSASVGSLAVSDGLIAAVGEFVKGRARETIDGEGLTLTPGFIDIHAHNEIEMLKHPHLYAKLGDGITTDCSGNCGIGVFPLNENREGLRALSEEVLGVRDKWDWDSLSNFKTKVEGQGVGINTAFLCAHAPLRVAVLGAKANREADSEEIARMCSLLDETLSQGARGFSSGLYYAPCLFASREELKALLSVVKKHDAFFAVHHRCEGDDVIKSVEEVLSLAKDAGVRLEISHLKVIGKRNQNKVDTVLAMIEKARAEGVDVKFDQYPYTFGSTSLFSLLPPDVQKLSRIEQRFALSIDTEIERIEKEMENPEGWDSIYSLCGPENIRISELTNNREFEGLSLVEAGKKLSMTPLRALLSLFRMKAGQR
jgi:N-acyl-D-aspartate/D-glutamate deacylase